jgi:ABC-type polysaccharide/polyol phosphate export permease
MLRNFFHTAKGFARESWDNRAITWQLAYQKIVKEYKGTALGVLWAVLQPLAFVLIFWFAIEIGLRGARNIGHDFPFILWLIPAIFAWRTITVAIGSGGNSVRSNAVLVTRAVFPKITIPQFVIISLFIVHVIIMIIAMLIFVAAGYPPTIYWLQLVYAIAANFIFCLVVATLLSAITVFSKDLIQFIKTIMTGLFWFSAIIWPLANLENVPVLDFIVRLNPIVYIIEAYRWSMIYGKWFWHYPAWTVYFWVLIAVLAIAAIFIWGKVSRYFSDVL